MADSLSQLRQDFEEYRDTHQDQMDAILEATDRMTAAYEENTRAVAELADNTQDVVTLYADLQAAARVGLALQKFVVWVGKWGAIGAAIATGLAYVLDYFKP